MLNVEKETCLPCSRVVAFGNMFTLIGIQHFVNVDPLTQVILNKCVNIIFILLYSDSLFEGRNVYVQICKIKKIKTLFRILWPRCLWRTVRIS